MSANEPCAWRARFRPTRWTGLTRPENSPWAICCGTSPSPNAIFSPENILGGTSRYTRHGKELADGREDILALMERLHGESMEIFSSLSDADLQEKCRNVGGSEIARWKWLRSMVEHEIHHRGQIYLYLGLLGVPTPPLYGLTSEEVRARGQA